MMNRGLSDSNLPVPQGPIDRLIQPVARFLHIEAASGVALLVFTVAALALANSPWADVFLGFWKTKAGFTIGPFEFKHSIKHLINDGLMVMFFFVVGLEVKRELAVGELREFRRAALPIAAAVGGMVVPAGFYLLLQHGQPGERGWGVPMATDIAFVVGCLALLGPSVPHGLRVFLLSLAIVDDIGAILVIAVGYSGNLSWGWLGAGAGGLMLVRACALLGVRNLGVYTVLGLGVWFAFHESGVHATIAGVILGLMTPAKSYVSEQSYRELLERGMGILRGDKLHSGPDLPARLRQLQWITREVVSPLEFLLNALHPWVAFVIMPLFAFANAGVPIRFADLTSPISLAIAAGLILGKPIGIVMASWLSVRSKVAQLPDGVGWAAVVGGGCLAGIGFTMALFIAGLALQDQLLDTAKIGILWASAISAVIGMLLLRGTLPRFGA